MGHSPDTTPRGDGAVPAHAPAAPGPAPASALRQDAPALDDPLLTRMETMARTRLHGRARIVMGSATFLDAFDALSLAFVLPVLIREWHISAQQIGYLIAASYVGQLVGALCFSRLAERYGRIPAAAAATGLMSVMSIGCALVGNFPALFACRLIQGVGVGGEMPVAATYISEMSRAHGRGRFFMLYELIFPVGLMATGQIGTVLVPALGWKAMFLVGGIPGLAITFLLLRLPESPRWLIARGRRREAAAVLERLSGAPVSTASVSEPVRETTIQQTPWRALLAPAYRSRSLIAWALWAAAYLVANSLNNWMPTFYSQIFHQDLRTALRLASLTNVAQVALLLLCAFFIDRIGRRLWLVGSFIIAGLLLAFLGVGPNHDLISVVIFATVGYGVIGSANAVLYLYTPEIYPTRMRAIGTGLATSWLRLGSAVGPALVGLIIERGGIGAVFLMFSGFCALGAVVATQVIETRGRRLEAIAA